MSPRTFRNGSEQLVTLLLEPGHALTETVEGLVARGELVEVVVEVAAAAVADPESGAAPRPRRSPSK